MNTDCFEEDFLKFEYNHKLFELKHKNVYFWNLIRFDIYLKIIEKTENSNTHPNAKGNLKKKLAFLCHIPSQIYERSRIKPKDLFISCSDNRKIINGVEINPYIDFFKNYDSHFNIINLHSRKKFYLGGTNNSLYIAFDIFRVIYKSIFKEKTTKDIENLLELINNEFNIKINVKQYCKKINIYIDSFLFYKSRFVKLIKNRFKAVVLVDHYNFYNYALIEAAKECNIPSVELQHGLIGLLHIAYNFLDLIPENKYIPDYLFTFGDYWSKNMRLPDNCIPVSVGYPQMDDSRNAFKDYKQDDKTVVFYSAGLYGSELSKLAIKLFKSAPEDLTIKYKLHPSECSTWKSLYPDLMKYDINVIDEAVNVHELLAAAKYHVGVNSTVLFEAFAFNGSVFAYNIAGIEHMEKMIEEDYVKIFDDEKQLLELIKSEKESVCVNSEEFFRSGSEENIIKEIYKIINNTEKGDCNKQRG